VGIVQDLTDLGANQVVLAGATSRPLRAAVLPKTLRERVAINELGQRKTVTKVEAALKQLVNKAASGDLMSPRSISYFGPRSRSQAEHAGITNHRPERP
jgi:hypothetical protein